MTERIDIVVSERGARTVRRNLDDVGESGRRAGSAVDTLRGALRALGAAVVLREIFNLSESFTRLQNAVRLTTDDVSQLGATTNELFRIANRTRTPVEAMATLFQRASIASQELGASQEELFQFTETVGFALAATGRSAAEASGALLQLSQALGSGIVRAEEFNSILEGAFPLAQAAARGIDEAGGSVARLRQLIVDGEIESREFFEAILSQSEELEATFDRTNATISQSFTVLNNSLIAFVGALDQALGVSSALAAGIGALASAVNGAAEAISEAEIETDALRSALAIVAPPGVRQAFQSLAVSAGAIGDEASAAARQQREMNDALREAADLQRAAAAEADTYAAALFTQSDALREVARADLDRMRVAVEASRREALADAVRLPRVIQDLERQRVQQQLRIQVMREANVADAGPLMDAIEAEQRLGELIIGYQNTLDENLRQLGVATEQVATIDELLSSIEAPGARPELRPEGLPPPVSGAPEQSETERLREQTSEVIRLERALSDFSQPVDSLGRRLTEIGDRATDTGAQIADAFENGFRGAEDALASFVTTGRADFKALADSIIQDIVRIAIRSAILGPLSQSLGGVFGGGGGSLFGSGSAAPTPVPTLGGVYADGGYVSGPGTGRSDSITARLSNGEFVVNAAATARHRDTLEAINSGVPQPARGDGVTVNVINRGGGEARTQRRRGAGGTEIIDVIIEEARNAVAGDIARGGTGINQALNQRYGLNEAGGI